MELENWHIYWIHRHEWETDSFVCVSYWPRSRYTTIELVTFRFHDAISSWITWGWLCWNSRLWLWHCWPKQCWSKYFTAQTMLERTLPTNFQSFQTTWNQDEPIHRKTNANWNHSLSRCRGEWSNPKRLDYKSNSRLFSKTLINEGCRRIWCRRRNQQSLLVLCKAKGATHL